MKEGTPLFSPANGMAYFLLDERPFDTNLGNYVEIVEEGGNWLVRLAHLRDPQSGERWVRAGEFIGYSGSSGVPVEHLHLEVLVRDGARWVRPDIDRMDRFFGLAADDFVEGAIITNDGCAAKLVLDGEVRPPQQSTNLGEAVDLLVRLRNDGLETVSLNTVQVLLADPTGTLSAVEARGEWVLEAKAACTVAVLVKPNMPGRWEVRRVTYRANSVVAGLPARGTLEVAPSPLRLVRVSMHQAILDVGAHIALEASVENKGSDDVKFRDLHISGIRPDGVSWTASVGRNAMVPARGTRRFTLHSSTVPQSVGLWRMQRIGYERDDGVFFFDRLEQSFAVFGPELRADGVEVYTSPRTLQVFLGLTNVGTQVAAPDTIEVWGWRPDGKGFFSAVTTGVAPLPPGASALIRLAAPLDGQQGVWRLVEAGHWADGDYCRIALPEQPAVSVHPPASPGAAVP